jgi:hypothetical protein
MTLGGLFSLSVEEELLVSGELHAHAVTISKSIAAQGLFAT